MTVRQFVFNGLKETLIQKRYSNLIMKQARFDPQDQRFASALFYTTLQNFDWMCFQVESYLKTKPNQEIMIILAMACSQYYLMDAVAPYAIVNEAVELTKQNRLGRYSGLVNAVLKKCFKEPVRHSVTGHLQTDLAINTSHPQWMVGLFLAQLGIEQTKQLLLHNNTVAPLYVRLHPYKITVEEAMDRYGVYIDGQGFLVAPATILNTAALEHGELIIQDIASQQVVSTFEKKQGVRFLDCCCAPGTKLSQLALFDESEGVGIDLHPHRIELTKQLLKRWDLTNVTLMAQDFLDFEDEQGFDSILCDVPCSGLGVLRRKADLKYSITSQDLDELQDLQAKILDKAYGLLKVGGELVYSTCTLNKKENEKQMETFLQKYPDMKLIQEKTLYPWQWNSDGFYIAHCRKEAQNMIK